MFILQKENICNSNLAGRIKKNEADNKEKKSEV